VTSARHKKVVEHATRRRLIRTALPAAAVTLVTGSVVGIAVGAGGKDEPVRAAAPAAEPSTVETPVGSPHLAGRVGTVSRSAKRVTLQRKPEVKDRAFMTAPLNLWPAPNENGEPLAVLQEGGTVALTGVTKAGFAQILHEGQLRWVNDDYLSDERPQPAEPEETERAVCNAFPALSTYGGYDGHGEHATGRAVDFMVSDPAVGQALADWCRAHASELGLAGIIWSQRIWTLQRSSEGWRPMEDRGSATANHYDHVHVLVS
jgi:hypothetical protein